MLSKRQNGQQYIREKAVEQFLKRKPYHNFYSKKSKKNSNNQFSSQSSFWLGVKQKDICLIEESKVNWP